MAAECRYALTGVGAAIAAGNQKLTGKIADLEMAPARISTSAVARYAPPGRAPASTICDQRYVPAYSPSMMKPISMARPPTVVTMRAWLAARRLPCCSGL